MVIEKYFALLAAYARQIMGLPPETWLMLGLIAALFAVSSLGLRLAARRGGVPEGAVRALNWLFLIFFLHWAEARVVATLDAPLLDTPLLILKTVCWWFFLRNALDGLYADLYLGRIKQKPVNHYFIDLFKFLILLLLVFGALKTVFDFQWGSILTSSAILTAVIGFSMQDTIGSLVSGFLIQLEKPFSPGDWIAVSGQKGMVVEISWRYTKIQTIEKDFVLVPNNSISKDTLVNYSRPILQVRSEVAVPVPLEVPPVKVKAALEEVVRGARLVAETPEPVIRADDIRADRIIYAVIFFARRYEDLRPARDEIISSVWYQFRKHGIELPYPITEMRHVRKREAVAPAETVAILRGVPLFSGLGEAELSLLVQSAAVSSFEPGRRIVTAGGTDTSLFVILAGQVAVKKNGAELARLNAGDFFGEMALLTGEPRTADVEALSPVTSLAVDREAFKLLLEKNQSIVANITAMFKERSKSHAAAGRPAPAPETLFGLFKKIFF